MGVLTAAITLFLIMDPLGNLPIFISILDDVPQHRRRKILIRELLISLFIMFIFLFAGKSILGFLHLKQESVGIAGGVVLFLIAIKMIFPAPKQDRAQQSNMPEPFLVPLAIPMIAGPSILAALILLASQDSSRMLDWTLALIIAWVGNCLILLLSEFVQKLLRKRGLIALERLMGMILIMIAVQMLLDGVGSYLSSWAKIFS